MKLLYKSLCGRYEIEFDEPDNLSLFEKIAAFQEVFENDTNVTIENIKVPITDIKLKVRGAGTENRFYEASVVDGKLAGYRLDYSVTKNGGAMFPKRKDRDGGMLKNNGWYRYEPVKKDSVETVVKEQKTSEQLSKGAPY